MDWGVFGGGLSNVVVLWGARKGGRQQSIRLFLDRLVNVREQSYNGKSQWLIDFWNDFGEYPIDPYKPTGYESIEITLQRLAQQMTGEEGIATDAEALAYVSNASLAVPLAYEWVEIYQYLLTRVLKDKVPDELRRESLDDWRMGLLRELKQWLWRQRVKARQERARGERAKASLFSNNG